MDVSYYEHGDGQATLHLDSGDTLGDALDNQNVDIDEVDVTINGDPEDDLSAPLREGDRITVARNVKGG